MDGIVEVLLNSVFDRVSTNSGLGLPQWDEKLDLGTLSVPLTSWTDSPPDDSKLDELAKSTSSETSTARGELLDEKYLVEKIVPYCTLISREEAYFVDILKFCWKWIRPMEFPLKISYTGADSQIWNSVWAQTRVPVVDDQQRNIIMVDSEEYVPKIPELQKMLVPGRSVYIEQLHHRNSLYRFSRLATLFESSWIISSPHAGLPFATFHFVGVNLCLNQPPKHYMNVMTPFLSINQSVCARSHRNMQRLEWIHMYPYTDRSRFTDQIAYQKREEEYREFLGAFKPPPSPSYLPTSPLQNEYRPTSPIPELVL